MVKVKNVFSTILANPSITGWSSKMALALWRLSRRGTYVSDTHELMKMNKNTLKTLVVNMMILFLNLMSGNLTSLYMIRKIMTH